MPIFEMPYAGAWGLGGGKWLGLGRLIVYGARVRAVEGLTSFGVHLLGNSQAADCGFLLQLGKMVWMRN